MSSDSFDVGFRSSLLNPLPTKKSTRVSFPMLNSLAAAIKRGDVVSAIIPSQTLPAGGLEIIHFYFLKKLFTINICIKPVFCLPPGGLRVIPFQTLPSIHALLHRSCSFPDRFFFPALPPSTRAHCGPCRNRYVSVHRSPRFRSHR